MNTSLEVLAERYSYRIWLYLLMIQPHIDSLLGERGKEMFLNYIQACFIRAMSQYEQEKKEDA